MLEDKFVKNTETRVTLEKLPTHAERGNRRFRVELIENDPTKYGTDRVAFEYWATEHMARHHMFMILAEKRWIRRSEVISSFSALNERS